MRKILTAFIIYSFTFFFLTWPLLGKMSTHIIGFYNSDVPIFLWNAWEWQNKFIGHHFSYFTKDIFYPNGVSLILHTHTLIQSLFVIIFNLALKNIVLSYNVVNWLSAVAGAFFAYLFFFKKTKSFPASLLAGQFFGFQHLWAVYSLFGTQNILCIWYIPAALCAYAYFEESKHNRYLILSGLVLGLAWLNDFNMFAFTCAALGLYVVFSQVVNKYSWKCIFWQWGIIAASFLLVSCGNVWYIFAHRSEIANMPIPSVADVDYYHADPINLFHPSKFHAVFSDITFGLPEGVLNKGSAFLGFSNLLLLLTYVYIWKRKRQKVEGQPFFIFGLMFLILLLFSFGPFLHIAGFSTHIPMPYFIYGKILPQFNNLRVPMRWLLPAMFFLAGLMAYLLKYIFENLNRRVTICLTVCLSLLMLFDSYLGPKNMLLVNVYPEVNKIIQHDPGVVLELPLAISSGFYAPAEEGRINQLHQVAHGQPIVGGTVSRAQAGFIEKYEKESVLKYLLQFKTQRPDEADLNKKSIQQFFDKYKIKDFIINNQLLSKQESINISDYMVNNLGLTKFFEDKNFVAYKKIEPLSGFYFYLSPCFSLFIL